MRFPRLPPGDPLLALQEALRTALVKTRDEFRVEFDAKDHAYTATAPAREGEWIRRGRVPSVTQILNGFGSPGPAKFVPAAALERGTKVHAAAEEDVAPDVSWASLLDGEDPNPLYDGYRMAWKRFKASFAISGFVPLVTEALLYHSTLEYCGQADYIGSFVGSWATAGASHEEWPIVVVDLKSGNHKMAKRVSRQVGGYVEALHEMIDWAPLIMGCGVGLAGDGQWNPTKLGDFRMMRSEDCQAFLAAAEAYRKAAA